MRRAARRAGRRDADVRAEEAFWARAASCSRSSRARGRSSSCSKICTGPSRRCSTSSSTSSAGAAARRCSCSRSPVRSCSTCGPAGRANASSSSRSDGDDVRSLLGNLLRTGELHPAVESRIETAAEGNPLFIEELVRMLIDDGALVLDEGRWVARDSGELSDSAVDQRASLGAARPSRAGGAGRAPVRVGDRQAVLVERRRRARPARAARPGQRAPPRTRAQAADLPRRVDELPQRGLVPLRPHPRARRRLRAAAEDAARRAARADRGLARPQGRVRGDSRAPSRACVLRAR